MSTLITAHLSRCVADRATSMQLPDVVHAIWDLTGLTCYADAVRLERHLRALPGVRAAVVNPATERIYLTFDRWVMSESVADAAISGLGYRAWRVDLR